MEAHVTVMHRERHRHPSDFDVGQVAVSDFAAGLVVEGAAALARATRFARFEVRFGRVYRHRAQILDFNPSHDCRVSTARDFVLHENNGLAYGRNAPARTPCIAKAGWPDLLSY